MYTDQDLSDVFNKFSANNKMSKLDFINSVKSLMEPEKIVLSKQELVFLTFKNASLIFDITEKTILGKCRDKQIVKSRCFISNYLKSKGMTYKEIGRICGKDHSSIMHQVNTFKNDFKNDDVYAAQYNYFVTLIEENAE